MSAELGALAGVAGFISNSALQAQQADYNRKAQARAFEQSLEAQNRAPVNYATGLTSAGLPIGMAMKGAFQTSQAPSPMPISTYPVDWSGALAAGAAVAQTELIQSQKLKLDAETAALEKRNQREADEDFTLDASLRDWLRERSKSDDSNAAFYGALADSPELFSRGTLEAIKEFDSTLTSLDDSQLKVLSNRFYKAVFDNQLNSDIAEVVAQVPKREQLAFFADLTKVYTEVSKLLVDTDLDKAKIQETFANIDKLISDSNAAYHKDFAAMVHNKDYLSAGISLLGSTIQAFGAGAGATAGASLAGKVATAGKVANKAADAWKGVPFPAQSNPSSVPHPDGWRKY